MKFPPQNRSFGKNQFRCFLCREVYGKQDGDWINWAGMQVHLCVKCDHSSKTAPERNPGHKST